MLTLLFLTGSAWCAYWLYKLVTDWGHRTSASNVKALCATCKDALSSGKATDPNAAVKPLGAVRVATATKPAETQAATTTVKPDYLKTTTKVSATTTVSETAASRTAANDCNVGDNGAAANGTAATKVVPLFKAPAEKDDLKTIKGIGVVMEKTLNDLGITTFRQLADFQQAEVKMVSDKLSEAKNGFGDRIERDEWVDQAKGLVKKAS